MVDFRKIISPRRSSNLASLRDEVQAAQSFDSKVPAWPGTKSTPATRLHNLGAELAKTAAVFVNGVSMGRYGNIVSVYSGTDEPITTLTDDGISEIKDMLAAARQSTKD